VLAVALGTLGAEHLDDERDLRFQPAVVDGRGALVAVEHEFVEVDLRQPGLFGLD